MGQAFTTEVKTLDPQNGGLIEQFPPGTLVSDNDSQSSAVRFEDLLRGMALTHQITIHAAEGWAEINLAMDLMLLAAHQITMAMARRTSASSSTKDNGITRGATAVGATSMGAAHTGQLFPLGILKGTNMEPIKLIVNIAIDLPAELTIAYGIEFFKGILSIKEIKQALANSMGRTGHRMLSVV